MNNLSISIKSLCFFFFLFIFYLSGDTKKDIFAKKNAYFYLSQTSNNFSYYKSIIHFSGNPSLIPVYYRKKKIDLHERWRRFSLYKKAEVFFWIFGSFNIASTAATWSFFGLTHGNSAVSDLSFTKAYQNPFLYAGIASSLNFIASYIFAAILRKKTFYYSNPHNFTLKIFPRSNGLICSLSAEY